MSIRDRARRALSLALVGGSLAACDFADPDLTNPNQVGTATLDQLFTSIQVTSYLITESETPRLTTMWMNQVAGTDRQYQILDEYIFTESDGEDVWNAIYAEGGLIALRAALELAAAQNCTICTGILKIHEAYFMGMAADTWGDVPFTEAAQADIDEPSLTPQLEVYDSVQALLSSAIADLQAGEIGGATSFPDQDLNFGADPQPWLDVAHSLKARYFMHVAELQGTPAYQSALDQAQQGIMDPRNNWLTIHTTTSTESNLWFQFMRDRSGYISGGEFLIALMNGGTPNVLTDDDPRLPIYFEATEALEAFDSLPAFIGSPPGTPPGDPGQNAAIPNTLPGGAASAAYDLPIVSCAETQGIIAEAALQLGQEATARAALRDLILCQEDFHDVELDETIAFTTPAADLLEEILRQKYIALFMNQEVWMDYKRTCLPDVPVLDKVNSIGGTGIPERLFYPQQERQTNEKIPPPAEQPALNTANVEPCPVT